jgi:sugar diacid utilization regulator
LRERGLWSKLSGGITVVCVENLTKLDIFKEKNIELISGKSGLFRHVSWPFFVVLEGINEWLIGGDVIIFTGTGVNYRPELLDSLIEQGVAKNSACMIVLQNDSYIKEIGQKTKELSDSLDFPLFVSPWDVILSNLSREIAILCLNDQFKEQMMSDVISDILSSLVNLKNEDMVKKIEQYGLTGKKRVLSVCLTMNLNKKEREYYETSSNRNVYTRLLYLFKEQFACPLFMRKKSRFIFLIDGGYSNDEVLTKCQHIHRQFKNFCANLNVKIGIGQVVPDTVQYSKSYKESELALRLDSDVPIRNIDDLGLLKFLVEAGNVEQVKTYAKETLEPLLKYDERHNLDLVRSLSVLCSNDMNINQSAIKLSVHKNTLLKRIDRIEDVLGVSLKNVDTKNHLYGLFKVLNLF